MKASVNTAADDSCVGGKFTKIRLLIIMMAVLFVSLAVAILMPRQDIIRAVDKNITVGVMSYNILWDSWSQAETNDIASKITTNNIDFTGLQEMQPIRGPNLANVMTALGAGYSSISASCATNPIIYKSSRWSIQTVSGVQQSGSGSLTSSYGGYTDGNTRCYTWGIFQDSYGNRVLYLNFHLSYSRLIPDATLQQLRINQAHDIGNKVFSEWGKSANAAKNPLIMTCDCNTTTNAHDYQNAVTALQYSPDSNKLNPSGGPEMSKRALIEDWTDYNSGTNITIDHIFYDYRAGSSVISQKALPYNSAFSDHRAIVAQLSLNATEYVPPTLSVAPNTISFNHSGGSQNVGITSNSSWTVTDNADWLNVNNTSGSGNGNIAVTASQNSGAARNATVTISVDGINRQISVSQAAAPVLNVSANSLTYDDAGGPQTVNITSNVSWTVSSDASWIAVDRTSGSNNSQLTITVNSNVSSDRNATVTVSGSGITKTISISQSSALPSIAVSKQNLLVNSAGGSETVNVVSNINWSAVSNVSWISVSPTSGSGNGSISVTVEPHTETTARSGKVFLSGNGIEPNSVFIEISQGAAPVYLSFPDSELSYNYLGGMSDVYVTANVAWDVYSDTNWLDVAKSTYGPNNGVVQITVPENNSGEARTATITVTGGGITKTISVSQSAPELTVSQNDLYFGSANTLQEVAITSNTDWVVSDDADWIMVSPANGNGDGLISITASANTNTSARTATVTVSGSGIVREITVSQDGEAVYLDLSVENLTFDYMNDSQDIVITANTNWTVSDDADWLAVEPASGERNSTLSVTVDENSGAARSATITVRSDDITKTISVSQNAVPSSLSVSSTDLSFGYSAGVQNIEIMSNVVWNISDNAAWLTINPVIGSNNGTIAITAVANTGAQRNAVVTIIGGGITKTIYVNQDSAPSLLVSPPSLYFDYNGGSKNINITANIDWNVSGGSAWATVGTTNGIGNGSISVNVPTNNSSSVRNTTVTIAGGGITHTVYIEQSAPPPCDPSDPDGECYEPPCDPTDPGGECYVPPVQSKLLRITSDIEKSMINYSESFSSRFTVKNIGPADVQGNSNIVINLHKDVQVLEGELDDSCAYNSDDNTVNCVIAGALAQGQEKFIDIEAVNWSMTGDVDINSYIFNDDDDVCKVFNNALEIARCKSLAVFRSQAPILRIEKNHNAGSGAVLGQEFTYKIVVSNIGGAPTINDKIMIDTIPADLEIVKVSDGCDVSDQTITCVIVSGLGGSNSQTFDVVVRPTKLGEITNTAIIQCSGNDMELCGGDLCGTADDNFDRCISTVKVSVDMYLDTDLPSPPNSGIIIITTNVVALLALTGLVVWLMMRKSSTRS